MKDSFLFLFSKMYNINVPAIRRFALISIYLFTIPIHAQNKNVILEDAVSAYNNNDFKNAFELFQQASKMNNGYGYLFLGWCYEQGKGTIINLDSALTCYKKAALLKNKESCYRLGLLYINGLGVKQSEKKALAWYKKGQIREEDAYQRAYDLASGKVKEFTLKDLNIPNAENVLSYEVLDRLYYSIKGDTEFDEDEQEDNGFKEHNMCFLAICYERGLGGCSNINYERAVYWYEEAQQNPNAPNLGYILCRLGYLYHKGLGIKKDNSKAVNWLKKAALLNDPKAIVMLGWMYEKGYGVKKNIQYANELYSNAQNIEKNQLCFEQVMSFRSIKNLFSGDGCIEDNIEKALYWEEIAKDKESAFPKDSISPRPFYKSNNVSSQKQRFIALVIGNDDYENGRLENPVRDAKALKEEFENMGITTVMRLNGNQQEMEEDVAKFAEQAKEYDAALFYFSGHALQLDGENYLFPVGENLPSRSAVKYKCVSLSSVIENLLDSGVKNNVVILDACRDNPYEKQWYTATRNSYPKGLSNLSNLPVGVLLAFATQAGETAEDGSKQKNSPYAAALLEALKRPQSIDAVFNQVKSIVLRKTKGKQMPIYVNNLKDELYLKSK